jgi:hypothetical protein
VTPASLRRLVLTFSPDGIQLRALYKHADGPGPSTKARRREVERLARTGLERVLKPDGGASTRRVMELKLIGTL